MILKKIVIDDKEVYERIPLKKALLLEDKSVLVFTDENEKDDFYDLLEEQEDDDDDDEDEADRIISLLPFLKDDEIHSMVESMLNDDKGFKDLPLVEMMPFLSDEDCDALFTKAISGENSDYFDLVALVPFVSENCLTKLVDNYIEGKYPDLEIDDLYPFMSSEDVKRIFEFFLAKRKEESRKD